VKKYIKVVVSQDGFRGSKISAAAGPVEDRHPLTGSVSITGAAKYGETLSVDISKLGGIVPPLKYQWQRSGSADGAYADIPGATNASYTLAAGDVRKYIKIVVGQYGFTGNVPCTAFGPVKPDVRSVTVKGPPVIKQNGSGTYTAVVEVLPNESQYKDVTWSIVAPGKTGITGVKNTAGYTVSPAMAASLGAVTIRAASSEDAQVTGDAPLNIKAFPVWAKADISWWPNNYITYNIAYGETAGNGRFVAGGDSGPSAYSTDGLNWWKGGEGFLYLRGIAFGNNRFVAVDYDGTSRWSTDGINWTNGNYTGVTVYEETATMGIAFGDGKFVVVGQFGKMAWSTDGVDWNPVSVTGFEASIIEGLHYAAAEIHDIVYANGRFVAVGGYGKAAYSGDGVTWTAVSNTTFSTSIITAITYGEVTDNEGQTQRRFVAASTGGKTAYSTDGVTWTAGGNPPGISYIADIAAGGGEFVAVSDNNMIAYSLDGIKWETSGNTVFQRIYAIAFGNGRFVVVTDKGIASYSP
jgi:hypothetical protein